MQISAYKPAISPAGGGGNRLKITSAVCRRFEKALDKRGGGVVEYGYTLGAAGVFLRKVHIGIISLIKNVYIQMEMLYLNMEESVSKIFLNDWRINGQEDYLMDKELIKSFYSKEAGHEHCIFCWHKFMKCPDENEDCSSEGYCTTNGKYWICDKCFNDFKEAFNWKLI